MDHLPKLGRRQRWLRAGRKHAVMSMWRALVALGLCAFIFGLTAGMAFAQTCTYWKVDNPSVPTFTSSQLACQAAAETSLAGSAYSNLVVTVTPANSTQHWCSMTYTLSSNNYAATDFTLARSSAGSGSQCPVDCSQLAKESAAFRTGALDTACPLRIVVGSCVLVASGSGRDEANTSSRFWGPFRVATGSDGSCGSGTAPASEGPSVLAPGRCPGTVNGTEVPGGVPCGNTTQTGPSTSAGTPAGAASAPPGIVPGQSTTQVTTCTNGSCTTVTNIYSGGNGTAGSGTLTGTATETQTQDNYCQKNPSAPQCKDSDSSFGGSCAGFNCDGDAVQCAIAYEQHRRNCLLYEVATPQSTAGYAALSAGDRPGDHPANDATAEDLDFSSRIDQTDRLGGGSLADLTVPVGNLAPVVIPFSQLQSPLAMLGNLLVGVSMLWALFIVFGRAK